jgi:hypothetical protein
MLDQILLELQPRLTGYRIVHHEINPGRFAFLVRVPQSFRAPHSIGNGKGFFYRTNSGRDAMNVDQLREAFIASVGLETKLQQFRNDRVSLLWTAPPFQLIGDAVLAVLHVMPVVGVSRRVLIDVIRDKQTLLGHDPPGFRHVYAGTNFEGCFIAHGFSSRPLFGYAQWFRNGFREIVWAYQSASYQMGGEGTRMVLDEDQLARNMVHGVAQTARQLRELDVPYPFYIACSVLRCRGYRLGFFSRDHGAVMYRPNGLEAPLDRYDLLECLVESEGTDIPTVLKPSFDQFAQAFSLPDSMNYDDAGRWRHG